MNNNDVLRRIRYTFDFSDSKMIALFALADHSVTREQLSDWLKRDDDPAYQDCDDLSLSIFLNGLIIDRRGKREGPQPEPETTLTNNIVLRKIKIALDLKNEDILDLIQGVEFPVSKHELSAFFRKAGHKNYRHCNDQFMRYFLLGMQRKYHRGEEEQPRG